MQKFAEIVYFIPLLTWYSENPQPCVKGISPTIPNCRPSPFERFLRHSCLLGRGIGFYQNGDTILLERRTLQLG
jgi:hypothetical protein